MNFRKSLLLGLWISLVALGLSSCSSVKYVSDGEYLLDEVTLNCNAPGIEQTALTSCLSQQPNFKVFGMSRVRLGIYNMSGRDTSKGRNRWLRRSGEAPVIYNPLLSTNSCKKLQIYLRSKGYLNAVVTDSVVFKGKRAAVYYNIDGKTPYRLRNIEYNYHNDTVLGNFLNARIFQTKLDSNMLFDTDVLDAERTRLATVARRRGYYFFNKESISYLADSAFGSHQIDLTLVLKPYFVTLDNNETEERIHPRYSVRDVNVLVLKKSSSQPQPLTLYDTVSYGNRQILYSEGKPILRPKIFANKVSILPGMWYNDFYINRTYQSLAGLDIIRSADIRFTDLKNDSNQLSCNIVLTPNKRHSVSLEMEGTNSSGDLGFAVSAGYQHLNLFHGSEVLGLKFRVAEEALNNSSEFVTDFLHKNTLEFNTELSLKVPKFLFPFLNQNFRKRINTSTAFTLAFDKQMRPEYNRTIVTTGMKYMWNVHRFYSFTVTPLDINYVYLPWISNSFLDRYSDPKYSVLLYSYSDHFIVNSGVSMTFSNEASSLVVNKTTFKISLEEAGNVLYGINSATNLSKNDDGHYEIGNIPYAQYVKGDFDYAYNRFINSTNRMVFHAKLGLEFPYGNADIVPFEKRFFSGGANSVRGWAVRTLGPGSYTSPYSDDFVNQSGNIELCLNMEYRSKLFWKFEGAAFVDAGNVWNIKEYDYQPEGTFYFDKFIEQMGLAYGLGLRADFTYFLIRFDMGMKAYNPALSGSDRWRYSNITWDDDFAFHFALGYPF